MRNETDSNLEFSYLEFKKILGETKIKYFFVDKDLQNLELLLKKNFPGVIILLCTFHVIKYIHSYLANEPLSSTEKANVMTIHSLERHWVNGFYYLCNIDKILTFFTIGFVNKLWWRFRRMAFI